ncbi:MAG: glycosyltransferase [Candidatus Thiodiazotropha sp.]
MQQDQTEGPDIPNQDRPPRIIAVTVTYNVDPAFETALESVLDQVERVVIVDNSTQTSSREWLQSLAQTLGGRVQLILNQGNLGLAKAQNIGIVAALEQGAEWILLMDDDSLAEPGMVRHLHDALSSHDLHPATRILVPRYQEQAVVREARYVTAPGGRFTTPRFAIEDFHHQPVIKNLFIAISSGSLIRADLFRELGLIREAFDIDYLDVDFCLRTLRKGYRIVAVGDAVLRHHLGAQTEHRFLGRRFWAWNHAPRRRFTIYRNRTRIWREYLFRLPGFVLYDLLATAQDLFRILMFEQDRGAKLWAVLRGMGSGLFGSLPQAPGLPLQGESRGSTR